MDVTTALLLNGITGAVADIALNDISRIQDFAELRRYFQRRGILYAAATAGLTVAVGALVVFMVTHFAFDFAVPTNSNQLLITLASSFAIGWIMDTVIHRARMFSDLDAYYKKFGAGFWGATSLVVSMTIALSVQSFVLPYLK